MDIEKALRKAYSLGQRYWQQADSEYVSQNKKASATEAEFDALISTAMAELSVPVPAMPIPKQEPVAVVAEWVGARSRKDRINLMVDVPMGHTFLKGEKLYAEPQPAQAAAIPEGWKLVPIRPTDAMLDAAAEKLYGHPRQKAIEWVKEEKFDSYVDDANDAYCAMLSASPKPE